MFRFCIEDHVLYIATRHGWHVLICVEYNKSLFKSPGDLEALVRTLWNSDLYSLPSLNYIIQKQQQIQKQQLSNNNN